MDSLTPNNRSEPDDELQQFEERVRRYQGSLFAYLGRLGLNQSVAEEIAQETCLKAWRYRHRFDAEKGAYATWLFRIARNLAYTECQRRTRVVDHPDLERVSEAMAPEQASDSFERYELQCRIDKTLSRLSAEDREAIALSCIEELSSSQASVVAGCSPGSFRTRLSRARQRFISLWEKQPE